jgi:hypothetical protein
MNTAKNPPARNCEVHGTLRLADGSPAARLKVTAFDRDLRAEQRLGDAQTDKGGAYRIEYTTGQFAASEARGADLVVKAFGTDGELLAASPVLFNAPPRARIDLAIPADNVAPPSLFEWIDAALAPVLGELKPEELEENTEVQDLSFLAGECSLELAVLARFAAAHRLAKRGVAKEFWFAPLGGTLFEYSSTVSIEETAARLTRTLMSLDEPAHPAPPLKLS